MSGRPDLEPSAPKDLAFSASADPFKIREYHLRGWKPRNTFAGDIFRSFRATLDAKLHFLRRSLSILGAPIRLHSCSISISGLSGYWGKSRNTCARFWDDHHKTDRGTRPRGETHEQDWRMKGFIGRQRTGRTFDVADLGRNDVGVAKIGTVRPTEEFIIERYSHVMHIVSNVVGELSPSMTRLLPECRLESVRGAKNSCNGNYRRTWAEKRAYMVAARDISSGGDMDMCCIALPLWKMKSSTSRPVARGLWQCWSRIYGNGPQVKRHKMRCRRCWHVSCGAGRKPVKIAEGTSVLYPIHHRKYVVRFRFLKIDTQFFVSMIRDE